jgi:hypothetical protein
MNFDKLLQRWAISCTIGNGVLWVEYVTYYSKSMDLQKSIFSTSNLSKDLPDHIFKSC